MVQVDVVDGPVVHAEVGVTVILARAEAVRVVEEEVAVVEDVVVDRMCLGYVKSSGISCNFRKNL